MISRTVRATLLAAAVIAALAGAVALPHTTPTASAGGTWSAWIYSRDAGQLVQVFPDGMPANSYAFPLPPGVSEYPSMVTFSRDGTLVAACNRDSSDNTRIDVYDMVNNVYVGQHLVGEPTAGCSLSRYGFSEDGSLLAFGLLYSYANEPDQAGPISELLVLRMNTNEVIARLPSDSPQMSGLNVDLRGKLPFVSTFQMPQQDFPGLISFKLVQWGTEGLCEYPGWSWNLGQNSVYEAPNAGKADLSYLLPNGEATWVETDESLPLTELMGPACRHNVVMYSNKAGDRYALYHDGNVVSSPSFVDGGRQIAFRSFTDAITRWYALDRSGSTSLLPDDIDAYRVWGTLDGYVFLNTGVPDGTPEVRYHRFDGSGGPPQTFSAWTGQPGQFWEMVYVTPLSAGAGLPAFPPMPQVGTPPQPPSQDGQLTVNGRARVNTTEGDALRVRTGPGISFTVAFQLPDSTAVTLVEGPVNAEGYTWWRIQTDDGRSGWAVEGVQDPDEGFIQTLVPAS